MGLFASSRLFGAIGIGIGTIVPSRRPADTTEIEVTIPDLPAAFEGYTIVALADLHHRHPWNDLHWLRHAVDITNDQAPDAIALLGDYGSSFKRARSLSYRLYHDALDTMTPELRRLRAKDAVVAVIGNHDYYADPAMVRRWLRGMGAVVLVNQVHRVTRDGHVLRLAGLDDVSEGSIDTRAGCDVKDRSPTVVLSHNPDGIREIAPDVRVDVVLAGHTHGGQIVLPVLGAPFTMCRVCGRKTASGWVPNDRAPLYVTRGLGEQLPLPIRVRSQPEVLVLRLRTR